MVLSSSLIIPDPGPNPIVAPGLVAVKEDRRLLVTESNWNIMRRQEMGPYEEAANAIEEALRTGASLVNSSFSNKSESAAVIGLQNLWVNRISDLNKRLTRALASLNSTTHEIREYCPSDRSRRSPFSFMGSLMHTLFGVMDENGERMVHELTDRSNQLLHFQKQQASVVTGVIESMGDFQAKMSRLDGQILSLSKRVQQDSEEVIKAIALSELMEILGGHVIELVDEIKLFKDLVSQSQAGFVPRALVPDNVLGGVMGQFTLPVERWVLPSLMETRRVFKCKDSLIFHVFLPVPVARELTVFHIFTPSIPLDGLFLSFSLPTYVAVPLKDLSTVVEFAPGELESCKKTQSYYLCPGLKIQYKDPGSSCALKVIDQNAVSLPEISKFCDVQVSRSHKPFFHFLPASEKIVYSVLTNTRSTLTCGNMQSSHVINGTGVLTIPASCTLQVEGVTLRSPRASSFPGDVLQVTTVDTVPLAKLLAAHWSEPHKEKESSSLVALQLQNRTQALLERQASISRDLNGVDDLSQRVGSHGVRDLTWLGSLSSVIIFIGIAFLTWWGVRKFKGRPARPAVQVLPLQTMEGSVPAPKVRSSYLGPGAESCRLAPPPKRAPRMDQSAWDRSASHGFSRFDFDQSCEGP